MLQLRKTDSFYRKWKKKKRIFVIVVPSKIVASLLETSSICNKHKWSFEIISSSRNFDGWMVLNFLLLNSQPFRIIMFIWLWSLRWCIFKLIFFFFLISYLLHIYVYFRMNKPFYRLLYNVVNPLLLLIESWDHTSRHIADLVPLFCSFFLFF